MARSHQVHDPQFPSCTDVGCTQETNGVIDDAERSLHNSAKHMVERTHTTPTELIPAMCALRASMFPDGLPAWLAPELGTEDLEDAYRGCPTSEESAKWCIVLFFDHVYRRWRAAFMYGHSFGFKSSVNNFGCYPELLVAAARRLFFVCTSHYVDDFPVFDHSAADGSAQVALNFLANLCGMFFAIGKKQLMAKIQQFLGQVFDLSTFLSCSSVWIKPKPGRAETIQELCETAISEEVLAHANAGRLRGLVQYLVCLAHI
jgi:hypothetical protein